MDKQSDSLAQASPKNHRLDLLLGLIGAVVGFAVARVVELPVYAGSIAGLLLGFAAGEAIVRIRRTRISKMSGGQ